MLNVLDQLSTRLGVEHRFSAASGYGQSDVNGWLGYVLGDSNTTLAMAGVREEVRQILAMNVAPSAAIVFDYYYRLTIGEIPAPPAIMSINQGMVARIEAPRLAAQGFADGADIPTFTDILGNRFSKVAGGNNTLFRATKFGGAPCLEFNDGALRSTDSALLNAINGAGARSATVLWIGQLTYVANTEHYLFGWGNSSVGAFSEGQYVRVIKNDFRYNYLDLQAGVNANTAKINTCSPSLVEWYRTGGNSVALGDDGVVEAPFADVHSGISVNSFVLGCYDGIAPVCHSQARMWGLYAWNVDLTAQQRSDVRGYVRQAVTGLDYKSGLGAILPPDAIKTRVFMFHFAQSNLEARGGARPYRAVLRTNRAFMIGLDGYIRTLAEPLSDNANAVTGGVVHDAPAAGIGNIGASSAPDLANGITAAFPNDPCVIVPCSEGSTTSADWVNGLATAPPNIDTLVGLVKLRTLEAMKLPGAVLAMDVFHLGTSNALTPGPAQPAFAAQYQTDGQSYVTARKAWLASMGISYEKTVKFAQFLISTINTSILPFCHQVVAAQLALQAANSTEMISIQAQDPNIDPNHLHEDTSELAVDGENLAVAYLAAT